MKKILVGKTDDGGKLFFVVGGKSDGIFQQGKMMTGVNFWDFVDKRIDLSELRLTKFQKRLWSRDVSSNEWVAEFLPSAWKPEPSENPYNKKVSTALDTIRTTTDLLF